VTNHTIKRALAAVGLLSALLTHPADAQTRYVNGRWFDGARFVEGSMYSTASGELTNRRPRGQVREIDLQGGYVVPAYGDAHHHGIDGEAGLDAEIAAFLRDGIFYVKNPNVIPDLLTPAVRARINRPDSIDVVFANGGITATGGHPGPLHDRLADQGVFPGLRREHMPERAYFAIDDLGDLATTWPKVLAGRPDFIKVFLNGRARLAQSGKAGGAAGASPEVVRALVRRAHRAGLRVTAHVDTGDDFAAAVQAGVDELGHMPAYNPTGAAPMDAFLITDDAAAEAARRGVVVTPTAGVAARLGGGRWSEAQKAAVVDVHRRNLETLRRHRVTLAIGSDGISGEAPFVTARSEIEYLAANRLTSPLELLRMWAVNTPKTIHPDRKVGELRPGYRADFLVLEGDPLVDVANLHRVRLRIKAGSPVRIGSVDPAAWKRDQMNMSGRNA
jgi:imidazolonepropionase-like amidohydrolase